MRFALGLATLLLLRLTAPAQVGYTQEGMASYYADEFEGKTTASGERFSQKKATCAHATIPFGALVRITNMENSTTVIVRVNDRGPFVPGRIVDVSRSVAERLGMISRGTVRVSLEVVDNNGYSIQQAEPQTPQAPRNEAAVAAGNQPKGKDVPVVADTNGDLKGQTELFTLKAEMSEPKGFSVQIGSYKELVNVLRIAADVQSATRREVKIQVATINGEKIYRLMVGSFSSRKDAEAAREKIAKVYRDCFIVELKE